MCDAPADPHDITQLDTSHGNSMIVDPAENVLDEAESFEQRLVTATLDLKLASRTFPLRILGRHHEILELYKTDCENPKMRNWQSSHLAMFDPANLNPLLRSRSFGLKCGLSLLRGEGVY